jgi:hypothetical protein
LIATTVARLLLQAFVTIADKSASSQCLLLHPFAWSEAVQKLNVAQKMLSKVFRPKISTQCALFWSTSNFF